MTMNVSPLTVRALSAALIAALGVVGSAASQDGPFRAHLDVTYRETEQRDLKLDVYVPTTHGDGPHPVVLYIHGGGWVGGDKQWVAAEPLTEIGYAVVSIQYRFSTEALWPAQLHDCRAAVRWVRAHAEEYSLDPERIVAAGSSAGGHLAAMLGTAGNAQEHWLNEPDPADADQSFAVQGVINLYGPADLREPDERTPWHLVERLLGGAVETRPAAALSASPIAYVDAADPPFLMVHGDADPIVPIAQSRNFNRALERAGVDTELLEQPGVGHEVNAELAWPVITAFLDDTLTTDE
ncbi:MAG: alpha/beta hydrolase [Planctomycetota bacterium]